jgi:hypothetical protein
MRLPIQSFSGDFCRSVPSRWFTISSHNTTANFLCVSELIISLLNGEDQSLVDQPNSLTEGPPMHVI